MRCPRGFVLSVTYSELLDEHCTGLSSPFGTSSGLQTGTQFPSMFSFCVGISVAVSDACTVACIMHISASGNKVLSEGQEVALYRGAHKITRSMLHV